MLAVLDTMVEKLNFPGETEKIRIYYDLLESDSKGKAPDYETFDKKEKSCLHKIAKRNNKVSLCMPTNGFKYMHCIACEQTCSRCNVP